uniref:SFRICE_031134 n=1 Tax=Spodoptera frugiperda TaxID=7108 RepID=A0A2H1WWE1_SPOFR
MNVEKCFEFSLKVLTLVTIIEVLFKRLTVNRKLLKANPPLTSVTGDHHGVQCVKTEDAWVVLGSEQRMTRAAASAARPRMVAATRAGDQRSARRASHSRATPHTRNTWRQGNTHFIDNNTYN